MQMADDARFKEPASPECKASACRVERQELGSHGTAGPKSSGTLLWVVLRSRPDVVVCSGTATNHLSSSRESSGS